MLLPLACEKGDMDKWNEVVTFYKVSERTRNRSRKQQIPRHDAIRFRKSTEISPWDLAAPILRAWTRAPTLCWVGMLRLSLIWRFSPQ